MNVEAVVIAWLAIQPELDGVPVSAEVPKDRPARFVTVERVGGGAAQFVDAPTLAIQAWAGSRYAASELARTVRDTITRVTELEQVVAVTASSMYNWPDPDGRQSRYQVVVDLRVKWNH